MKRSLRITSTSIVAASLLLATGAVTTARAQTSPATEAAIVAAKARLDQAQASYERALALDKQGAVTEQAVEKARTDLDAARAAYLRSTGSPEATRASVTAARSAVAAAESRVDRTTQLVQGGYAAQSLLDSARVDLAEAKAALAKVEPRLATMATVRPGPLNLPDEPEGKLTTRELIQARRDLARSQYDRTVASYQAGREIGPDALSVWSRRWMEAEVELAGRKSDRVAAAEAHADRMRVLKDLARARYQAGVAGSDDMAEAQYHYLEAEQRVQDLKRH
jgi:outer membrane protein TolC